MVVILNYLNAIILVFTLCYLCYLGNKMRKGEDVSKQAMAVLGVSVALLFVLRAIQPSYLPKGQVTRSPVPEFEYIERPIQNLQPQPMSGEERDNRRAEAYKEPLPFIEKKSE